MLHLKRILTKLLTVLAAVLLWFEEWLWELLKLAAGWIAQLPPLRWLEEVLTRLPPYGALAAFAVPGLMLLPAKMLALWAITHHHAGLGVLVVLGAKVLGTTLVTRTFVLCKPQLMTIHWFAWLYDTVEGFRQRIYELLRAMPIYQRVRAMLSRLRKNLRIWLRQHLPHKKVLARRWRALRRRLDASRNASK